MIADRPQVAAVVKLEKRDRNSGTSILIGHWVEQALQARQPDIASLTSCEKSYSPLRACQLLRVRSTRVRRLARFPADLFFQLIGVDAAIRQQAQPFSHQRGPPLRRVNTVVADLHRRTHRAFGIKVEAQTVAITLHRAAPRAAHGNGDLPIEGPRLTASTFIIGASTPSGGHILPGFRRLSGSNAALILRSSPNSSAPKNAGLYSARKPFPCSPTEGRHTWRLRLRRHRRCASSASLAADRTYPAPAARAARRHPHGQTCRSSGHDRQAAREIPQYSRPDSPAARRYLRRGYRFSGSFGIPQQANGFFRIA